MANKPPQDRDICQMTDFGILPGDQDRSRNLGLMSDRLQPHVNMSIARAILLYFMDSVAEWMSVGVDVEYSNTQYSRGMRSGYGCAK